MNIVVDRIMRKLSENKNPFFVSEGHFQVAFIIALKEEYPNIDVFPEYVFNCKKESKTYHIDLVIVDKDTKEMYAFEFKYVLGGGHTFINGEKYSFRDHSATDIRRAQFLYDIFRLENVMNEDKRFKNGYAIILTNMSRLYDEGTSDTSIDQQFDISSKCKNIKSGLHKFKESTHKYIVDNINLAKSYQINWKDYKENKSTKKFCYLSVKIDR